MNRRRFIKCAGLTAAGLGLGAAGILPTAGAQDKAPSMNPPSGGPGAGMDERFVREAMFYDKRKNSMVECRLCPWQCLVKDGARGRCGVRENRGGTYYTLVYGRAVALHNDPIEKKPFNHFRPGTSVLSAATAGCNFSCKFCQNWQISQFRPEQVEAQYVPPEKMVELAHAHNIPNIALTYSEPTVFFEYMYETARLASRAGIKTVVVSNGFISKEALETLIPYIAAYRVDLKSFRKDYYRDMCSGRLEPVLDTLRTLSERGVWTEIINLVLPTANDEEGEVRSMVRWIRDTLGPMTVLHFTRFRPMYKIRNLPPTPVSTLKACHRLAREEGLHYVYTGNVPGLPQGNTYCHHCGRLLIERYGLYSVDLHFKDGRCPRCGTDIPGVWS